MSHIILIVENDENDIMLTQRALSHAHIFNPVVTLPTIEEAQEYFLGKPPYGNRSLYPLPAILLTDLRFPGGNGLSFLRWLKENGKMDIEKLLVMVLTGYRHGEEVQEAYKLGVQSFLSKPVHPQDLINLTLAYPKFWITLKS